MSFYSEYYLSDRASRFISKVWVLDNRDIGAEFEAKSILPNGCFNLALVSGPGLTVRTRLGIHPLSEGWHLCAQMTQKVDVEISPMTRVIIIQFHAWALASLMRYKFDGFVDQIKMVHNHYFISDMSDYSVDAGMIVERVECFLEQSEDLISVGLVERVCSTILERQGESKIGDLASQLNCSTRTLQLAFRSATGLTLKQYSDIIRFRAAVDAMTESTPIENNLAQLAQDHLYFDQNHFIKAFKNRAESTPGKFEKERFVLSKLRR